MGGASTGRLDGKVALITGAGSGIGWAAAKLFAAEGARVVCVDVTGTESDAADAIGDSAVAVRADVTHAGDVQRMVDVAVERFGGLDVLFNNAGIGGPRAKLADTDEDFFDRLIAVNLKGVFLGMKYALPVMLRANRGAIINTASASALVGWKGLSCYAATKAGVVEMTKSAALDYARSGIRINAICPGMTYTGRAGGSPDAEVPDGAHLPTPMARWGEPAELAAAALFLASDDASFITGAALPVDGGYSASGPMLGARANQNKYTKPYT
ncbi:MULTISPECIES: SDR family NAD(P)-dependent oxidoreductase [unclassified Mycobacterium]|uniref:SDR family NAD(P)-dependent oxidoreductase n=1 Tax=unclassified Mycobacterium TaxID=2642494 RepID=UPI0029C785E9|nr:MULTISPECIES: SDR family NAD(P)-dependent oxidoreductase [unclassified Mycobacterium]